MVDVGTIVTPPNVILVCCMPLAGLSIEKCTSVAHQFPPLAIVKFLVYVCPTKASVCVAGCVKLNTG